MTLTINLTRPEEQRLQAVAAEYGIAPEQFAHQLLSKHLFASEPIVPTTETQPKKLSGYGMFAHVAGGSEAFALEKQKESEREDNKFEPRS